MSLWKTTKSETVSKGVAPYATQAQETRGRFIQEPPSSSRTEFQRDRDRIIHSGAFRKLRNKTQVFIENEGDYYRTRLTHSLEVAQIARSVTRSLDLNEDLAETVALAHDLGHACFGHMGENALAEKMEPFGGFDHNDQTFRILTFLECGYAKFDGLNLTWETLEGIAKHNGPLLPTKNGTKLSPTLSAFNAQWDLELDSFAGAEAQIASLADDIAYNTHDMDDGFRAGFFDFSDLSDLPLFGTAIKEAVKKYPNVPKDRVMHEVVRDIVGMMVSDLTSTTRANILALAPQSVTDIRHASKPVASFSPDMKKDIETLRVFLKTRMYRHSKVNRVCAKADRLVREIFDFLMANPNCLPNDWFDRLQGHGNDKTFLARMVADYIAGMTDPFAVREHRRLFSTETMI